MSQFSRRSMPIWSYLNISFHEHNPKLFITYVVIWPVEIEYDTAGKNFSLRDNFPFCQNSLPFLKQYTGIWHTACGIGEKYIYVGSLSLMLYKCYTRYPKNAGVDVLYRRFMENVWQTNKLIEKTLANYHRRKKDSSFRHKLRFYRKIKKIIRRATIPLVILIILTLSKFLMLDEEAEEQVCREFLRFPPTHFPVNFVNIHPEIQKNISMVVLLSYLRNVRENWENLLRSFTWAIEASLKQLNAK